MVCDVVLPAELVEFPVIRNNTPSRDEVRKVSSILNSAFKLKLSRSKREIDFYYSVLVLTLDNVMHYVVVKALVFLPSLVRMSEADT